MVYDVFISYKNEDKNIATGLFDFLRKNRLSVFLDNRSINETDYAKMIDEAIENSKNLIVITSQQEYLTSGWVKYEWQTFNKEILSGRKDGQLFTIIDDDIDIDHLTGVYFNEKTKNIIIKNDENIMYELVEI